MKAETDVVIGVDAHKRTHTLVAADELGREVAAKTLPRRPTGISPRSRGRSDGRGEGGRLRTAGT